MVVGAFKEVAPNLTEVHYRWRNDDGSEGGFDTGSGADGAISLSAGFNLNTQARAGRTYPDGVAYRVKSISGTSITLRNAAGSTLGNTNGIAAGDEILIVNLQGSSGDNGSVGTHEFLDVQSVSGGVVTVVSAPTNDYDGSGNSFTTQQVFLQRVPNYTNVTTNAYSITAGAWDGGTDHNDSGCTANMYTGAVVFRATGTVTVSASGSITVSGRGYQGGAGGTTGGGTNGESYDGSVGSGGDDTTSGSGGGNAGTYGGGGSSNYAASCSGGTRGGGGGGGNCDDNSTTDGAGGGGGGGYGGGGGGGGGGGDALIGGSGGTGGDTGTSAGGGGGGADNVAGYAGGNAGSAGSGTYPGAAGSDATSGGGGGCDNATGLNIGAAAGGGGGTYGVAALTTLFLGSGGGGGGGHDNGPSAGATGGAGGGVIHIIANAVTVSGSITSNGAGGTTASAARAGSSGGGAGGSILIQANSATLGTTLVTATGGSGGSAQNPGGGGGAGGVGRIRVEADTKTGTTSPTYSGASTPGGSGATWAAAEDTELTGAIPGTIYRLRFEVSNAGGASSGAVTYKLQVAKTGTCGSGTYADVPTDTSGAWQIVDSTYLTDGDATTNVTPGLTDAATTFVAGQVKDTGNTTGSITLTTTQFTEIEFSVKATINATYGGDYCFRLYEQSASTTLDTYTVYGQIQLSSCQFGYRRAITVGGTRVSNGPHTDFPMLVSISGQNYLKTTANDPTNGRITNANGYDIIFRALDDTTCNVSGGGTNPCTLSHEIEQYDGSAGTLVAWVKVPRINNNTVIYMYYGNSCITSATADPTGVWNSNYKGVWHLHNSNFNDSTSNGNNGTNSGTTDATGKIANGRDFDGTDDYVNVGSGSSIGNVFAAGGTFSAWIYPEGWGGNNLGRIADKSSDTDNSNGWTCMVDNAGTVTQNVAFGRGFSFARGRWETPNNSISLNQWQYVVVTYNESSATNNPSIYINGVLQTLNEEFTPSGSATSDAAQNARFGNIASGTTRSFNGLLDEVRIATGIRSSGWIQTEYNNQYSPSTFYTVGSETSAGVTAVDLLFFTATGDGSAVKVVWETAQEVQNAGFNLFRGASREGPFVKLNEKLIPGTSFLLVGDTYTYRDTRVIPWELYYYKLEDVDIHGIATSHGPISVDWDGDGIPDDWEIAHGLNPRVKDGGGDPDRDGVANLMEYRRGTDPLNPDTDGDGIPDGWDLTRDRSERVSSQLLGPGVTVIATDETGMTLELETEGLLSEKIQVGGTTYDRLRIPSYIHGYTQETGKPELPVKGILLDLPEGASASLRVGQCETRSYPGVLVYPVPEGVGDSQGGMGRVSEVFALDQAAYGTDAFYPGAVAALDETFTFRDQKKLQLLFYPIAFNPVTRELLQYTKIRVRVDYEQPSLLKSVLAAFAPAGGVSRHLSAWSPPSTDPAYRLLVSEEGIYRLTPAWFTAQGIGVDLSQVRLYNEGQEVALAITDGDAIEFYGRTPSSSYSKYAKYNVYWLTTSGGSGSPKRMAELVGTPGGGTVPATHTSTVHYEENLWYWLGAPGADSLERWFFYPFVDGSGIEGGGGAVGFTLTLPGVSGSGTLVIRLGGAYDTDHEVAVTVNGTPMASITWSGISFHEETLNGVAFIEGANTVSLQCLSGTDSIAVDWFEATYPRAFEASADSLKFTADGGYRFQVSEFTASELELFDLTSPGSPQQIKNFQVTGSGPYMADFEPGETGDRTYLVLASAAVKTPAGITRDTASHLASSGNGADYILITHRNLGWDGSGGQNSWLTSLVSLRESQGLRVKVVDIQDVFDEFSYGIETPQAVKDFLAYAYTSWQRPAPQYVLLVGDATYDPKGNWGWYLGDATATYLPTYLVSTPHMGETVTDEWFTRVSGDDAVPDLFIGRLPAVTATQAQIMVGKIVSYETAPNTRTWEKSVILVSDNATEDSETVFEQMNEDAAALLPGSMGSPFKGYLADYLSADDLTGDMKTRINAGALLVNYSGHGSTQILANERIFEVPDVADLGNGEKLPFFVSMTCLTGYFAYPESWSFPSLAETLLRAEGKGAVAAFMPTGMTLPEGQHVLDQAFFDALFTQDIRTLGPAVSQARQTLLANGADYGEVSETFLLFGDPAMGLKVPLPRRVSGVAAQGVKNGVSLTWQAALDCNGSAVSGYNLYRATSAGGPYVKVNSSLITGLSFEDTGLAAGGTYYYVVTAVDGDGLEGARSAALGESAGSDSSDPGKSGGGGGGGGCFVSTAADRLLDGERAARLAAVILAASLFLLFAGLCTGRRKISRPLSRFRGIARALREHRE